MDSSPQTTIKCHSEICDHGHYLSASQSKLRARERKEGKRERKEGRRKEGRKEKFPII